MLKLKKTEIKTKMLLEKPNSSRIFIKKNKVTEPSNPWTINKALRLSTPKVLNTKNINKGYTGSLSGI